MVSLSVDNLLNKQQLEPDQKQKWITEVVQALIE